MLNTRTCFLLAILPVTSSLGLAKECEKNPRFEDYPAADMFKGKQVAPKLVTEELRMFRTRIMEGAKEAPNFAGHYTVFTVGCGSNCGTLYIVDARTGGVFSPRVDIIGSTPADSGYEDQYRLDSRLMIGYQPRAAEVPETRDMPIPDDILFYEWKKDELHLICTKRTPQADDR